jgi:YegS/Rv2252/BmrU family lipid kinase
MSRKVELILNPVADMGNAWKVARDLRPIIAEYSNADWTGTVYPLHAQELAKQAGEQGYDLVIAVGGDGTVHEVINGLMSIPEEKRPMMAVVPVGSGNDFAHMAGIPIDPMEALKLALHGEPGRLDIGLIKDGEGRAEYFDNTFGIGFDAVTTIRSHKLPVLRGFLMYLVAVIQTIILNFDPVNIKVETDQESWELPTVMFVICNGPREGGGFHVAPDAIPNDNLFHYAMIGKVSRLMMFRLIPEVMKGTHGRFKQVRMGSLRTMKLTADQPLYIHTDGEIFSGFGTDVRDLTLEILPGVLKVIQPQK